MKGVAVAVGLVVVLAWSARIASAASWFVDSAVAVSGNGQSWAGAWKTFANIVWGSVQPGDTVFISGGTTSKNYAGNLVVGTNGTSDTARVTVRIGQDPGHTGRAILSGSLQLNNRSFVTIDGSVNGVRSIEIVNSEVQAQTTSNSTIQYLEIHGPGASIQGQFSGAGLRISFNYLYDISADAAISVANSAQPVGYDRQLIDNNTINLNRDAAGSGGGSDGIQGSWGLTIANNTFMNTIGTINPTQHQDFIQMQANYLTVRGNTFIAPADSSMDYDTFNGQPHHHRIYNNVFILPRGAGIRYYNSGGNAFTSIDNVLIENNSFVNHTSGHQWALSFQFFTGTINPTVTNTAIRNNIFYDCVDPVHIEGSSNATQANWNFDYNLIHAGPSGTTAITLDGAAYTQAHPRTGTPSFVAWVENPTNFGSNAFTAPDLHLAASDTAATGQGDNLSAVFTTDKDGLARPSTGAWDVGAYVNRLTAPPTNFTLALVGGLYGLTSVGAGLTQRAGPTLIGFVHTVMLLIVILGALLLLRRPTHANR